MDIETFLNELNPQQREAASSLSGPLLVLAGAGSGKTKMLTYRLANLILQGEATPGQIFAVTFTNKAAGEMAARTEALLSRMGIPLHEKMWVSTFHSSCARILRDEIWRIGYQPFFVIYDDGDTLSLLKKVCEDLNLNDKVFPAKSFKHQISQAKTLGLTPDKVSHHRTFRMDETATEVYQVYEDEMRRANALDFDDLLLKTYQTLKEHPAALTMYREKFRHILVDEYQDTNHLQYLLIKLLAEEHRNLCAVGDEDQSIYSWRGADIHNILDFEKDFPEAKIIKLEENYRSTANIVQAATQLISNNTQRKNKVLFTQNEGGSRITLQAENNEYDEARFVLRKAQDLLRTGAYSRNDIAIFYRTNSQSRVFEEQFRSQGMAYRIVGTVKFYERREVKDIICYMRLILNSRDDIAFDRVVNTPTRGIGKTTLESVVKLAGERQISCLDATLQTAEERLVHSGACTKLRHFYLLMESLKSFAEKKLPSEIYTEIIDRTGYVEKLKEENTPESQARLENLQEFHNAILQFESERGDEASLQSFLEEMALISDADSLNEQTDAVTLMTLHLSKGLEYKNVFIVGLEEGLFPSGRSLDDPDAIEEERRICYVGMTRARENLYMSFAKSRRVWGQEENRPPSRFLKEIPEELTNANSQIKRPAFLDRLAKKFNVTDESPIRRPQLGTPTREDIFPNYEEELNEQSFETHQGLQHFARGERVRHPVFGVGSIFQVEGEGEGQKVSVLFSDKSLKKFMVKHARLERV